MKAALVSVKGTHGLDGWTKNDLKMIAATPAAIDLWMEFNSWTLMGVTPSIIQQARVSCIGKLKDGDLKGCPASGFRPIMVQSCIWRAWSTMWIRAPCVSRKDSIFPVGMAGAAKGNAGPEVLAAMTDALLAEFKFGVSLDFSHA